MGLADLLGGLLGGKKSRGGAMQMPAGLGSLMGGNAGLLKVLLPMLAGGGLGGLLGKLTKGGLGRQSQSWVSTGKNEEVSGDELEQALGRDEVARMAREAGVSHDEAKSGLASMLPKLIDNVTPSGAAPKPKQLGGLIQGLDLSKILG